MKLPIILITYGFTQKLCTWEENDEIVRLPLFSEPSIAMEFIKYFKIHFKDILKDKDDLQVQVCNNYKHAFDMLSMIGMIQPKTRVIYNSTPLGEDPVEIISKISSQFSDVATVINKNYELDEILPILADKAEEADKSEEADKAEEVEEREESNKAEENNEEDKKYQKEISNKDNNEQPS